MSFSVRSFIAGVRESHPTLGPDELTKQVLIDLPATDKEEAFQQCLRQVVSNCITSTSDRFQAPVRQPERDSTRSWKTRVARSWKIKLEDGFWGPNGWIKFGDCTIVDLTFAAELRRRDAAALEVSAANLEGWSALLVQHGVDHIRDLPESVLRERLEGGSA
jgi:hypothetical protein